MRESSCVKSFSAKKKYSEYHFSAYIHLHLKVDLFLRTEKRCLTPHSATMRPLWTLLFDQSFPHTFEKPAELLDTLQTRPMLLVTLYNHLPRIHFWAKQSLAGLLVIIILKAVTFDFLISMRSHYANFWCIDSGSQLANELLSLINVLSLFSFPLNFWKSWYDLKGANVCINYLVKFSQKLSENFFKIDWNSFENWVKLL